MKNTTSIKDTDLFQKVMNKGQWYGGDFLSVYVLPFDGDSNMIGLAIGKKVGKAFKRNKVKRLIKEAYTILEPDLKLGYYIIFVWKNSAVYDNVSFNGIKSDLCKTFKKAGIL